MTALIQEMLEGLPSDAELAICELGRRAQSKLDNTNVEQDAVLYQILKSFISRYNLPINTAASDTHAASVKILIRRISILEAALGEKRLLLDVEAALEHYDSVTSRETFGMSRLTDDEKKKLHERLSKIRIIIEGSALSDRKKNALFSRLAELATEVDLHGTSTDRFFAFAGDMAFVLGDMANKAKPMLAEVKEILKIVSRSRAREEGVSLPPGDEAVLLPPPEADTDESNDEEMNDAD